MKISISDALELLGYSEHATDPKKLMNEETLSQLERFRVLELVLRESCPLFLFDQLVQSSLRDVRFIASFSSLDQTTGLSDELDGQSEALEFEIELRKGAVLLKLQSLYDQDDAPTRENVKLIAHVLARRCKNKIAAGTLLSEIAREHDDAFKYGVKNELMLRKLQEIMTPKGGYMIRERFARNTSNPQGAFRTTRKEGVKYYDYKDRLFVSWPFCISEWLAIYSPLIDFLPNESEWMEFNKLKRGSRRH